MIRTVRQFWNTVNQFNALEPDKARRGRVLNVLLLGAFSLSLVAFLFTLVYLTAFSVWGKPGNMLLLIGTFVFALGALALLFLNRRYTRLAGLLFLLLLTVVFVFSDVPSELANGRSSFVFFIPIAVASLLLTPASSFFFAILNSIIIVVLSLLATETVNIGTIIGFFMLAMISWLSSNSLEQAIKDLRKINAELDIRVADRTRALTESLAREAAQASQREAILDSIADGVVVFDNSGTAIVANPSLAALMEVPKNEILGKQVRDLLRTGDLTEGEQMQISEMLEQARNFQPIRINWRKRTLAINSAEVKSGGNALQGTVAVFRDVTQEAELDKMKDTFLAIVSHEMKTPLNAILGFAEMIKEAIYGPVSEGQHKAAIRIMENTKRLLSIVSELLDQAQIQSGRMKVSLDPCRPGELVKNVQETMSNLATEKGIQLTAILDPALPEVLMGDPQRLQQIMINLINNSIKFSEPGSSVRMSVICKGDTHWEIQVADTGLGIPKESLKYIFDTFRQVETTAIRKHGGVGLGLAIVKQLVELMNGSISVESQVNVGSVFSVTLPLIQYQEEHQ